MIFAIGAFVVRAHDFGKYPADNISDEALTAVDAMAIVENGTDHYGTSFPVYFEGWGSSQQSTLYGYILAVFLKLFGVSTFVVRLPMLSFSLIGIAALTWMAWLVLSRQVALFVLAFAAINPWHIMASRWGLDANIFPHFLVIGFAFLFYAIKKQKKWALCVSFFTFGISIYGYGVAYVYLPFFMISIFLLLYFTKTFHFMELLSAGIVFFAISWPIILILAINYFQLPTITIGKMTIQFFEKTTRAGDILFFSNNILEQLRINFMAVWETVALQKLDAFWNQLPNIGSYYLISWPFTLVGIAEILELIKNERRQRRWTPNIVCLMILLSGIISSLIAGLLINKINVGRINHIYYLIIFVTAYGIYEVFTKKRNWGYLIFICYGVYFAFFCYRYYYSEDRTVVNYTFDKGLKEAMHQAFEIPGKICISQYQFHRSFNTTEISTIYLLRLPYRYYSGQMSDEELAASAYLLPYEEKFHYFNDLEAVFADQGENCTYVVNVKERDFFDLELFRVKTDDFFSVAIPQNKVFQNP